MSEPKRVPGARLKRSVEEASAIDAKKKSKVEDDVIDLRASARVEKPLEKAEEAKDDEKSESGADDSGSSSGEEEYECMECHDTFGQDEIKQCLGCDDYKCTDCCTYLELHVLKDNRPDDVIMCSDCRRKNDDDGNRSYYCLECGTMEYLGCMWKCHCCGKGYTCNPCVNDSVEILQHFLCINCKGKMDRCNACKCIKAIDDLLFCPAEVLPLGLVRREKYICKDAKRCQMNRDWNAVECISTSSDDESKEEVPIHCVTCEAEAKGDEITGWRKMHKSCISSNIKLHLPKDDPDSPSVWVCKKCILQTYTHSIYPRSEDADAKVIEV